MQLLKSDLPFGGPNIGGLSETSLLSPSEVRPTLKTKFSEDENLN